LIVLILIIVNVQARADRLLRAIDPRQLEPIDVSERRLEVNATDGHARLLSLQAESDFVRSQVASPFLLGLVNLSGCEFEKKSSKH
jgi:hypothetical protein